MSEQGNPKGIESNPIGQSLDVNVTIPRQIEINLVDATTLNDLEIWIFITSVISNFVVGFAVAWAQANDGSEVYGIYKLVTIIFIVMFLFSGYMVYSKHKKLSKEKKALQMEVKGVKQ